MSVREDLLTGQGVALTLTLKHCPADAREWHRVRRAWIERMRRAGMVRLHWVTEWQRRGVPHLHVALWVDGESSVDPISAWLDLTGEKYGAGRSGQHARPIDGAVGWFQYLAKHASRGVKNYQRAAENIPEGWQEKTGRVWGHSGDWPLAAPRKFGLQDQHGDGGWFHLRRMVRSWRIADARAGGKPYRIVLARRSFQSPDPAISRIRSYREWMPSEEVQMRMIFGVVARGFQVVDRETGEVIFSGEAFNGSERPAE